MTKENKALAYELWLQHWSYADIAAHLEARQGDVIRIVAAAQRRQDALCARCRWRRDGVSVCLLPRCMMEEPSFGKDGKEMILNRKNIVEAARDIRLFCALSKCEECPFGREYGGIEYCGIRGVPNNWEITDDTRREGEPR